MSFNLKNRSFLKLLDFSKRDLTYILDLARDLKRAKYAGTEVQRLRGKNIALIFEKASTRTRCAFEVAAYDQGANVTYLDPVGSHMGKKESVKDTARVLGRMYDAIEYRGAGQQIVQELGNIVPINHHIVAVLTQILVDPTDPAFQNPTKHVGPIYDQSQAERLRKEKGWSMAPDGAHFRRVVPSPLPQRIIELNAIRMLVDSGVVVICAGGGGIPTAHDEDLKLYGVEAVIDKDLAASLLSTELDAEMFVMLTDVANVCADFGTPQQRPIRAANPDILERMDFAAGSMGPKIRGACEFVRKSGHRSAVGQLSDLVDIMAGKAGTLISNDVDGLVFGTS